MAEKDGKEQDPDFEMAPPVPTLSADAKAKPWRTERNELMCRLTDEEQRMRGQQLAAALKNYGVEEEQAKRHKEAMKALEEQAAKLREAVLHKEELRQVTCILVPDYEAATVTTFRADTGEMVTVRALEMSERQQELELDGSSTDDLATAADKDDPTDGTGVADPHDVPNDDTSLRCGSCASFNSDACGEDNAEAEACQQYVQPAADGKKKGKKKG